jgi:hypothetical protein
LPLYDINRIGSKLNAKEFKNVQGLIIERGADLASFIRRGKMSRFQGVTHPIIGGMAPRISVRHSKVMGDNTTRGGIELHELGHAAKGHNRITSMLARGFIPGVMLRQEKQAWEVADRFSKHPISKKMAMSTYKLATAGQVAGATGGMYGGYVLNNYGDPRVKKSWKTRKAKYGKSGRRDLSKMPGNIAAMSGGAIVGGMVGMGAAMPYIASRVAKVKKW